MSRGTNRTDRPTLTYGMRLSQTSRSMSRTRTPNASATAAASSNAGGPADRASPAEDARTLVLVVVDEPRFVMPTGLPGHRCGPRLSACQDRQVRALRTTGEVDGSGVASVCRVQEGENAGVGVCRRLPKPRPPSRRLRVAASCRSWRPCARLGRSSPPSRFETPRDRRASRPLRLVPPVRTEGLVVAEGLERLLELVPGGLSEALGRPGGTFALHRL